MSPDDAVGPGVHKLVGMGASTVRDALKAQKEADAAFERAELIVGLAAQQGSPELMRRALLKLGEKRTQQAADAQGRADVLFDKVEVLVACAELPEGLAMRVCLTALAAEPS